jgi:hypothetical protein
VDLNVAYGLKKSRNLKEFNAALADTGYRAIGPYLGHVIWKENRGVEPSYSYYILLNTKKFVVP